MFLGLEINDQGKSRILRGEIADNRLQISQVQGLGTELHLSNGDSDSKPSGAPLAALGEEIDGSLVALSSTHLFYCNQNLPFKDRKKLHQVLPHQIQDTLPFDIDSFIIDTVITNQREDSTYDMLSCLAPKVEIESLLSSLKPFGLDPKIITTKSAALLGLLGLFEETKNQDTVAIVGASSSVISFAIIVNGRLLVLRDVDLSTGLTLNDADFELRAALAYAENKSLQRIDRIVLVASDSVFAEFSNISALPFERLDLNEHVLSEGLDLNDCPWIVGLFVAEQAKPQKTLLNLRQGDLAYRPLLGTVVQALKEEMFWIVLAALLFIGWIGVKAYSVNHLQNTLNAEIRQQVLGVLPGERVIPGRERMILAEKTEELEEQLRGLGSLSSLTPLETLKELSQAIHGQIDTKIDSLSIGHSRVSFRGSVQNYQAVGQLISALENRKDRFCDVKVDSGGTLPGSNRVRVSAEIRLCD